ncbi:DUF2062 domain-containing protein [Allopontixanthobacter sp.]|uniref:DUF2062 domain-containing protein n=1 Tax=Allopontixanthobacter sp. TaxID=2906452 RepID=UPI002ABB6C8F|nr:DUF2062 domain-containing protein [Allopontixanthobacter sp.]MDZ4306265.1 DUF2062 domain-containing protein [Allopontixanthobacter sp.]
MTDNLTKLQTGAGGSPGNSARARRDQKISFRSKTFLADVYRKYVPTREEMAENKYLKPIAHRFLSPELWRFTRRSVPRGVALGLFAGFIIPLGQVFVAAFLALPARANVPLAALLTFVTNPFTFPFWAVVANRIGAFILKIDSAATGGAAQAEMSSGRWAWFVEMFEGVGITVLVTVFGFVVLSVVTAAIGYVLSGMIWRVMVGRRRHRRLKIFADQKDERLKDAQSAAEPEAYEA